MSKRPLQTSNITTRLKLSRYDEIVTVKKIIIRNDNDPHVCANIDCTYVKLGNYIYKVKPFDQAWTKTNVSNMDKSISLTLTQYNDMESFVLNNKITVS